MGLTVAELEQEVVSQGAAQTVLLTEVVDARGTAGTLGARLDVALNPDGTPRTSVATVSFVTEIAPIISYPPTGAYVALDGDLTAVYVAKRRLRINGALLPYVTSSTYDDGGDYTVVNFSTAVGNSITSVEYSFDPAAMPPLHYSGNPDIEQVVSGISTFATKHLSDAQYKSLLDGILARVTITSLTSVDDGAGVDLVGRAFKYVDTIDDLRTLPDTGAPVYVQGHTTPGDGGEGTFKYDISKAAIDDNGMTVLGWVRRLNGFVTPEMFGAVGDGVVLDTTALQSAINAHSIVYGTPGKNYAIASGTSILIPSNRILDFRMSEVTQVGATLNVKAFKNVTYFADSVFDENITIKNLTVNGNGSDGNSSDQGSGIGLWGVRWVLIENVKTNNTNGDGLQFRECYGTVLRNIEIGDYGRNGISPTSGEFVYDNVVISGNPFTGAAPGKDFDAENNSATERGVHDIRYIKCKNMTFVDFYNTTGNPFNHDIYFHAGDVSGYLPLRILSKSGQTVAKKIYISPLVNIECQDVAGNAAVQIESTDAINISGSTIRRLGATGTQRGIQIVGTCSGLVLNNVEFEGNFTRDIEASGTAVLNSSILNGVFYNLLIQGSSNKIRGSIETLLRIVGAASINNEISADVAAVSVETGAVLASQFFGNPRGLAATTHYSTEVTVGDGPTYDLTIPLPSAATSGRLLFVAAGYSYIGNASHWAQYFGTVRIGSGAAAEANVISATGAAGMSIAVVAVTTTSITLRLTYTFGGVFSATILG